MNARKQKDFSIISEYSRMVEGRADGYFKILGAKNLREAKIDKRRTIMPKYLNEFPLLALSLNEL